ncbi:hypothetical protein [Mesorhizobium ventifaucium]|uniref:Uncharacterized protein n=1 Tax=Mesorhizobium ventifaucium TaxID=666020 RepID=A0ABM9E7I1_9HYPH|nr:hypothetical protein [Mesorhizobium ventifaucium]CAH2405102.1 hypothetical protein MES4922_40062 [Mesorhizobium ventifaucium]
MIFIVANPQADGGSVGDDRSFLSQEGALSSDNHHGATAFAASATGPVTGLTGSPGPHPTASPIMAQHPRHQAIFKSLALPANPWDDAFG